jgi:hypothetical protein
MAIGASYDKILADAERVARVWEANPTFSMGDLTLAEFKTMIQALRDKRTVVDTRKMELRALVNEAQASGKGLTQMSARVRGGFKATFGPDSSQYEQSGGTRESEEKTPKPRSGKKDSKDSDDK